MTCLWGHRGTNLLIEGCQHHDQARLPPEDTRCPFHTTLGGGRGQSTPSNPDNQSVVLVGTVNTNASFFCVFVKENAALPLVSDVSRDGN
jgi:hypothetical protein